MCPSSYMKAMILTHCPREKPSASLDLIWNSSKLIPKAHSNFFSCGQSVHIISSNSTHQGIHSDSLVTTEKTEATFRELDPKHL